MNFFTHIEPWIWLAILLVFLLAYGALTVTIVNRKKKTISARRQVMLYMTLRVVRLLVYASIILVYATVVKIEIQRFVIAATLLFFIYLLFDTLFLAFTEKKMKKK